jgi:glutathione-regulated potassium-efflux system protein KefB
MSQIALFLAAAVFAAPLAKRLGVGSVLGYLVAGLAIGPFGFGLIYSHYDVENVLRIAEFGVVLLLFLIGLELKPIRLWTMRSAVFGFGGLQMLITTIALCAAALALGHDVRTALFVGLALALSSTAFALQVLEEKGELTARHGRFAFSTLLFQDLAAIPLIAFVPLFALGSGIESGMDLWAAGKALAAMAGVVLVGKLVLNRLYPLVAATKMLEAMTACALLIVVGVALIMEMVGLSAALGAFIAGAMLADSDYRPDIQANVAPFQGLLLGLFFTAIGMSLNLSLVIAEPLTVLAYTGGLLAIKSVVLYGLGRWQGLTDAASRRLALAISQGGEFAFVLFAAAVGAGVLGRANSEFLSVVVTLSMVGTPLLLKLDEMWVRRRTRHDEPEYDMLPDEFGHVIIAGFGRVGQIIARLLSAKGVRIMALDADSHQVALVRRFGHQSYYGDASRLDILRAAQADKARAFVVAIGDVELSVKTAALVRKHFPHVPVIARARNRQHVHRLMDAGVSIIHREAFLSSLELARETLRAVGISEPEARHAVETFRTYDRRRLYDDYKHASNSERMQAREKEAQRELEELLAKDLESLERDDAAE